MKMTKKRYKLISTIGIDYKIRAADKFDEPIRSQELKKILQEINDDFCLKLKVLKFLSVGNLTLESEKMLEDFREECAKLNNTNTLLQVIDLFKEPRRTEILSKLLKDFISTGEVNGTKQVSKLLHHQISSEEIRNLCIALLSKGKIYKVYTLIRKYPMLIETELAEKILKVFIDDADLDKCLFIIDIIGRKLTPYELDKIILVGLKKNYDSSIVERAAELLLSS